MMHQKLQRFTKHSFKKSSAVAFFINKELWPLPSYRLIGTHSRILWVCCFNFQAAGPTYFFKPTTCQVASTAQQRDRAASLAQHVAELLLFSPGYVVELLQLHSKVVHFILLSKKKKLIWIVMKLRMLFMMLNWGQYKTETKFWKEFWCSKFGGCWSLLNLR